MKIPLRDKDGNVVAHALIDSADREQMAYTWTRDCGYVTRRSPEGKRYLHREIMGLCRGDGLEVDHRNLDKLDCRRSNLRVVTHAQNGQNLPARRGSSAHRGVCYHKRKKKWMAYAELRGKRTYLGYYPTEDEAHVAASEHRARELPFSEADRLATA